MRQWARTPQKKTADDDGAADAKSNTRDARRDPESSEAETQDVGVAIIPLSEDKRLCYVLLSFRSVVCLHLIYPNLNHKLAYIDTFVLWTSGRESANDIPQPDATLVRHLNF